MEGPIVPANSENISRAARILAKGGLVAFPTETVYGLGAAALDPAAVARIFAAKGRPADHPLIVHLPDETHLDAWVVRVPPAARTLAARFWPGPLTLVLQRHPEVPDEVTGGLETVALRVPGHPVAQELLREFGDGLAAPSANRFGRVSPTEAAHVASELDGRVELILDGGPCDVGLESTIVDLTGEEPRVLRPGLITEEEVAAALGRSTARGGAEVRVPGSLPGHYAPEVPLQLVESEQLAGLAKGQEKVAVIARSAAPSDYSGAWLRLPGDPRGYGRELYRALRSAGAQASRILVELPPEGQEWAAVRDRLHRAATGSQEAQG